MLPGEYSVTNKKLDINNYHRFDYVMYSHDFL